MDLKVSLSNRLAIHKLQSDQLGTGNVRISPIEYRPNSSPVGPTLCRMLAMMLPTHFGAGSGPRPSFALHAEGIR